MIHELPDVQAGLRKGRETIDQISNICRITEKARKFQKNIYFCFTDDTKAFGYVSSVQSLSCVWLFSPGHPVPHQLPEFTQTHIHWVGDAIQPTHPLSSPSPPAFNLHTSSTWRPSLMVPSSDPCPPAGTHSPQPSSWPSHPRSMCSALLTHAGLSLLTGWRYGEVGFVTSPWCHRGSFILTYS